MSVDNFTSTVDGAAGHARRYGSYDDSVDVPSAAELFDAEHGDLCALRTATEDEPADCDCNDAAEPVGLPAPATDPWSLEPPDAGFDPTAPW